MRNKDCPTRIFEIYRAVYSSSFVLKLLKVIDVAAVSFAVIALAFSMYCGFAGSITEGVMLLALTFIPFALVSIVRILINAERPYQIYDFSAITTTPPKSKLGSSFPSRHV